MITGAIKALSVPENFCLTDLRQLVLDLTRLLTVEFDVSKITNVVVSFDEPDSSQRDVIWFRLNASGNFSGIFVFSAGQWLQMFPVQNQLYRVYGNSNNIPPGYALVQAGLAGITSDMYTAIEATWTWDDPMGQNYYIIFDVVYIGL